MMLSRLGVVNAFSPYGIFNLKQVYRDVIPWKVKKRLYQFLLSLTPRPHYILGRLSITLLPKVFPKPQLPILRQLLLKLQIKHSNIYIHNCLALLIHALNMNLCHCLGNKLVPKWQILKGGVIFHSNTKQKNFNSLSAPTLTVHISIMVSYHF